MVGAEETNAEDRREPATKSSRSPADAMRGREQVEDRFLSLFAPDAEVILAAPARTYRGRDQIRDLVRQGLPLGAGDGVVVRENEAGQITSLAAPLPAGGSGAPWTDPPAPRAEGNGMRSRLPWFLPLLGTAIVGMLSAFGTFLGIAFNLFPSLKPEEPVQIRGVAITAVTIGEHKLLADQRLANEVLFEVEAVGYDAEEIAAAWVTINAATHERLEQTPWSWGRFDFDTRADRVIGRIDAPPPLRSPGCVYVRVLLFPAPGAGTDGAPTPSSEPNWLLAFGDSTPFDPYDRANPSCPHRASTASPPPGGAPTGGEAARR